MKDPVSFDGTLQMFRDAPKPVNGAALRFLRWLAEQGRLEHPVAGPPSRRSQATSPVSTCSATMRPSSNGT